MVKLVTTHAIDCQWRRVVALYYQEAIEHARLAYPLLTAKRAEAGGLEIIIRTERCELEISILL